MGGSKKTTVGYWYKALFHHGLGNGPIDALLEVRGGDRTAWKGAQTSSGTITINAPMLWGGEKDQGGIVGAMDVMLGEATQQPNSYLLANLGPQIPAWRGIASVVFKGGKYGAMNPYPQPASYKIRRIIAGWDGACWNQEKAEICMISPSNVEIGAASGEWRYLIVPLGDSGDYSSPLFDDSGWNIGQIPFASASGHPYASANGFPAVMNTYWEINTKIWIRKKFIINSLNGVFSALLEVFGDNFSQAWVNGAKLFEETNTTISKMTITIPWWMLVNGENLLVIHVKDDVETGYGDYSYAACKLTVHENPLIGMNPAHMLYYSRTNSDMGGEDVANIDAASLSAAADTLFAEGFGLCTTRNPGSESVEEFEGRIAKVIGGAFGRDPVDGKWYLDLARGDYVLGSLPILTDDDVIEFSETPATLDSAINSVSVKYFDSELRETITTPPVQARGLIAAFGTNHQTFDYPEIPTADLALRVAQRELRATATPLRAFELVTTRVTHSWRVNTYFRLQLPKRGIADMVCIVGQKQSGTLRSGAIRIGAVQDVYSMPAAVFVSPESGVDTSASENPMVISRQRAIELPYTEVVQILSRADLSVLPADVGFLATVADDPARSVDYTLMVDDGSGYAQRAVASWCPTATVVEAGTLGGTAYTLAGGVRLDQVEIGSAALWGDEIVRVVSLDISTGAVVFGRGCADTVPQPHAAGERIWFITGDAAIDQTEYVSGETISVKLLTNTGSQQIHLAAAAPMTVAFNGRQIRPYPPGKSLINGSAYPQYINGEWVATWAHRDRLTQADQLIDTTASSVGPESGTTYTLRLYGETDTLLRTVTGLTGTSYTWTTEEADSGLGAGGDDPYWPSVVLLLHFDGSNGSATFVDSRGHAFTAAGNAMISTADYTFGGASGRFDGSGDYISGGTSADFDLGSGDFTVEWWIKPAVAWTSQPAGCGIVGKKTNDASGGWVIYRDGNQPGKLNFRGGGANNFFSVSTPGSSGAWEHWAITRAGGVLRWFVNGALDAIGSSSANLADAAAPLLIGRAQVWTGDYNGWIDDLRITKGYARYTAAFTRPTGAFPDGYFRLNNLVRAELESIRAGYTSLQKHNITTRRVGYGYSYGHSYGGL